MAESMPSATYRRSSVTSPRSFGDASSIEGVLAMACGGNYTFLRNNGALLRQPAYGLALLLATYLCTLGYHARSLWLRA